MNNEERQEMQHLCTLIQSEQDPVKFSALLEQLNDLLEQKEKRLIEKLKDAQSQAPDLPH